MSAAEIQFKQEFEGFLKQYPSGTKMESPTLYNIKYKGGVDLQFCGWSITLFPDGTYFFNDTSGG